MANRVSVVLLWFLSLRSCSWEMFIGGDTLTPHCKADGTMKTPLTYVCRRGLFGNSAASASSRILVKTNQASNNENHLAYFRHCFHCFFLIYLFSTWIASDASVFCSVPIICEVNKHPHSYNYGFIQRIHFFPCQDFFWITVESHFLLITSFQYHWGFSPIPCLFIFLVICVLSVFVQMVPP